MNTTEERLAQLEARMAQLEKFMTLDLSDAEASPAPVATRPSVAPPRASAWTNNQIPQTKAKAGDHLRASPATTILGWTGATALVLAAAYFIRLAIDAGWLTAERQVGLAVLFGLVMIALGFALRSRDSRYASLLPSSGIVVLFLAIYGAHLYYHLIGAPLATAGVMVVCLGSLAIGRAFSIEIFALFAVVGSYSAPFLLPTLSNNIADLSIYYSAWSTLFCIYAVWMERRVVYLVALYLALLGFDAIARNAAPEAWVASLAFQFFQFGVFTCAAVIYSVRLSSPMTHEQALAHLPALLLFYAAQYALLETHLPAWAPWIALGSLAFIFVFYLMARAILSESLHGAQLLLSAYGALVLFHAVYMETVPSHWAPWFAFVLFAIGGGYAAFQRKSIADMWPLLLAAAAIYVISYLRMVSGIKATPVPGADLLSLLYAGELYVAYAFLRALEPPAPVDPVLPLYAGHIAAMAAAVHLLDQALGVSIAWALLALGCLLLASLRNDKVLARSSLLVFGSSALKVLLYDLSSSSPGVRIMSLTVVGVTLYAGGWLYQRISADALEGKGA